MSRRRASAEGGARGAVERRGALAAAGRFFVTGTDTGVGKTEVSAALLTLLASRGGRPFAFKPCESGGTGDTEQLWRAAGAWQPLETVCLYRLAAPLAPMLAARAEGRRVRWPRLLAALRALGPGPGVVEGAGGLFVPFDAEHDVIDLLAASGLPAVLVARAGLGTINHTTLSLLALAQRRIPVAAVVLCQATRGGDPAIAGNRRELERRFPQVRFLGPVPFEPKPKPRRAALVRVLAPLVG